MSFKDNAFPIMKGNINLTSGTKTGGDLGVFWCSVAGSLTITWEDATTTVLALAVGDAVDFRQDPGITSVAITTGTFHIG